MRGQGGAETLGHAFGVAKHDALPKGHLAQHTQQRRHFVLKHDVRRPARHSNLELHTGARGMSAGPVVRRAEGTKRAKLANEQTTKQTSKHTKPV